MKPSPHPVILTAGALALASFALPSFAATTIIFSDDFGTSPTPGTLNDFGYYTQANSGGMWSVLTSDAGTTMSANFLRNGGSSANTNTIKQWMDTPVTLSGVGDSITVSFDMDSRNAFSASATLNLKIALYDSSYTITENKITGPNPFDGKVSGYGYFQTNAGGNVHRLTNFDATEDLSGAPSSVLPSGLYDQAVHSVSFSITKEAAGATFALYDGNTLLYCHTDPTATNLTFNTLRLMNPGVGGAGVFVDNISVIHTTAVPEPSSAAALAGLATLGPVATRRRRK